MAAVAWFETPGGLPVVETFHSLQGGRGPMPAAALFHPAGRLAVGLAPGATPSTPGPQPATHLQRRPLGTLRGGRRGRGGGRGIVVITGGEPRASHLDGLCQALAGLSKGGRHSLQLPALPIHLEQAAWIAFRPVRLESPCSPSPIAHPRPKRWASCTNSAWWLP